MKPQNSKIVTLMGGQGKSGQRKQEKLCYELPIVYLTYVTLKFKMPILRPTVSTESRTN